MPQDAPSPTTDATTTGATTAADAPKKRRPIFRDPLAIMAVCLAIVVSVANYLIGGYPEMYVLEDFQQMPKSQLATSCGLQKNRFYDRLGNRSHVHLAVLAS